MDGGLKDLDQALDSRLTFRFGRVESAFVCGPFQLAWNTCSLTIG